MANDHNNEVASKSPPTTKCPGCGVLVEWLSNCGRYRCVTVYGAPIVLDAMHRSKLPPEALGD